MTRELKKGKFMTMITNSALVQTVYTEKGNKYEKTSIGKKAGTMTGAVAGGACLAPVANSMAAKSKEILLNKLTSATGKFGKLGKIEADEIIFEKVVFSKGDELFRTVTEKLVTSKCGRLAVVAGVLAGAILAGRVLGSLVDTAINKFKAYRTDKSIEQKEAIISEYEAQKTNEE